MAVPPLEPHGPFWLAKKEPDLIPTHGSTIEFHIKLDGYQTKLAIVQNGIIYFSLPVLFLFFVM